MIAFLEDGTTIQLIPMQSMTGKRIAAILVTLEDAKPETRNWLTETVFTHLSGQDERVRQLLSQDV